MEVVNVLFSSLLIFVLICCYPYHLLYKFQRGKTLLKRFPSHRLKVFATTIKCEPRNWPGPQIRRVNMIYGNRGNVAANTHA